MARCCSAGAVLACLVVAAATRNLYEEQSGFVASLDEQHAGTREVAELGSDADGLQAYAMLQLSEEAKVLTAANKGIMERAYPYWKPFPLVDEVSDIGESNDPKPLTKSTGYCRDTSGQHGSFCSKTGMDAETGTWPNWKCVELCKEVGCIAAGTYGGSESSPTACDLFFLARDFPAGVTCPGGLSPYRGQTSVSSYQGQGNGGAVCTLVNDKDPAPTSQPTPAPTPAPTDPTPAPTREHCNDKMDMLKQCKEALEKSSKFMTRVAADAESVLQAEKEGDEPVKPKLGESSKPLYCADTLTFLKQCHHQLYTVTAFIEHVGAGSHGMPRPGFPGSPISLPPVNADGIVEGSTNDPNAFTYTVYQDQNPDNPTNGTTHIELDEKQQEEVEGICKQLRKVEEKRDTRKYEKDEAEKQSVDNAATSVMNQRKTFFYGIWKEHTEEAKKDCGEKGDGVEKGWKCKPPAEKDLPKCKGCWVRRRRADGGAIEVNSCPPVPVPAPIPTPIPTAYDPPAPSPVVWPDGFFDPPPPPPNATDYKQMYQKHSANGGNRAAGSAEEPTNKAGTQVENLEGYRAPPEFQAKWFYSALSYDPANKGTWGCNIDAGASACANSIHGSSELPCEVRGPGADAKLCKQKCDACGDQCKGFNYVDIPAAQNLDAGGLCVLHSTNPGALNATSCDPTTCTDDKGDKDFYCCKKGKYFTKIAKEKTPCPKCCSATGSDKCDGPTCQECEMDPKAGTCDGAAACCKESPPCDDKSCAACPVPQVEGVQIHAETKMKFNMDQPASPPWNLTGYSNPAAKQGVFYMGAVTYKGAGEATCGESGVTAASAEGGSCMAEPGTSRLQNCKSYCDADPKCTGFNLVYNAWTTNAFVRDAPNPGGVCVFMSKDPSSVASKQCKDWEGQNALCYGAYTDKKWYCCRGAYYYQKEAAVAITAKEENGIVTTSVTHQNGTVTSNQTVTEPESVSCMATEGDGKQYTCKFPFKFNNKEYSTCITDGHQQGKPWCFTDIKKGYWGECATDGSCKGPEKAVEQASCKACEGDAKARDCIFPVTYNGKQYTECIAEDNPHPWCYTDTGKGYWGLCMPGCNSTADIDAEKTKACARL